MLQVVACLQPCEVLGLLQVALDDPLTAAVVPGEHHRLLQELRVDLPDVRHLVVADVQHQQLHELTLGLDLGCRLQVVARENQFGDFVFV